MKRAFLLLVVAALIAVLPGAVLGQSGITWDSEIIIQNLASEEAYVRLYYYDLEDGGGSGGLNMYADHTIPALGNIRIYPLDVASPFNGSVVVESTQPVSVIVNEYGDTNTYGGAYEGFDLGHDVVRVPGLMSCNNNLYTFMNVQNAGSEETLVTVEFAPEPGKGYTARPNVQCTLDPGEACTVTQEPGSSTDWKACTEPNTKWVGGAKVTTDDGQPVVAAANLVHTATTDNLGMSSYSGFIGGGSPTAIMVNAMNANNGLWTGISVTNVGTVSTTITLEFYPEEKAAPPYYPDIDDVVFEGVEVDDTVVHLVPAHPDLDDNGTPVQWVGSVKVLGGGQDILALANTISLQDFEQSEVKGVDPEDATALVYAPVIIGSDATHPWWTGLQIYNTDTNTATVDIVFSESLTSYCGGTAWTPAPMLDEEVPPGQSIVKLTIWEDPPGTQKCYFGSATITSDGGEEILGLVGELAPALFGSGEVTLYYNAPNK
jgi:hypothetical protein